MTYKCHQCDKKCGPTVSPTTPDLKAVAFHSMSSMVAKRGPLRPIFRLGNSQKSLGARSGEYGGWVMTRMLFSARNCCTTGDVWLGANALLVT